jgi:hypothetical protein
MISFSLNIVYSETFPKEYFNGNWDAKGYSCNRNTPPTETMEGKIEGNNFILYKVIGDDCVTSGNETFRGTMPSEEKFETGKFYPNRFVVGNKWRPNSGHRNNKLKIKDINTFVSWGITYTRNPKITTFTPAPPVVPVATPPVVPVAVPAVVPVAVPAVVPVPPVAPAQPVASHYVYYYTNYFLGNWNGIGYTCDASTPHVQTVHIRYQNGNFYAHKLIGDNCVKAGQLSFDGKLPQTIWQGESIPVNFVIGSPEHPSAQKTPNTIRIIDLNTFQIGTRFFYRVMGANNAPSNGAYINMNPLIGHSLYPGPGYIKLNPKTNMRAPVRRFVVVEEQTNKPGNC